MKAEGLRVQGHPQLQKEVWRQAGTQQICLKKKKKFIPEEHETKLICDLPKSLFWPWCKTHPCGYATRPMCGLVLSFRVICHSSQAHGTTRALPFSQHPSGARHSPNFLRRLKSHPIPDLQACLSASSSPPSKPNIHPTYWCLVISVLGVAQGSVFFFTFE